MNPIQHRLHVDAFRRASLFFAVTGVASKYVRVVEDAAELVRCHIQEMADCTQTLQDVPEILVLESIRSIYLDSVAGSYAAEAVVVADNRKVTLRGVLDFTTGQCLASAVPGSTCVTHAPASEVSNVVHYNLDVEDIGWAVTSVWRLMSEFATKFFASPEATGPLAEIDPVEPIVAYSPLELVIRSHVNRSTVNEVTALLPKLMEHVQALGTNPDYFNYTESIITLMHSVRIGISEDLGKELDETLSIAIVPDLLQEIGTHAGSFGFVL